MSYVHTTSDDQRHTSRDTMMCVYIFEGGQGFCVGFCMVACMTEIVLVQPLASTILGVRKHPSRAWGAPTRPLPFEQW